MNKAGTKTTARTTSAAQLQKKQIQGLKHQLEQLSKFVIRLTKHYEGVTPELDKELQVLRSHLGSKSNPALAEASMSTLTGLLMQHPDDYKSRVKKLVSVVEESLRQLMKEESISAEVKSTASQFISGLPPQNKNGAEPSTLFERAIQIYQMALENVGRAEVATNQLSQNASSISDRLHVQICQELRELINQLSLSNNKDKQLEEVKSQLIKGLDHEELLECCLVIIKAIVKDVVKERKHAERFVSGLHSSLHKVNSSVKSSLSTAEDSFNEKDKSNEALKTHITNIEEVVESNTDIKKLKEQAAEHLAKLSTSLDNRERADKEEQMVLIELLKDMQSQLTNMEKSAAEFKHRLVEQKYQSHHDALTQVPNRTAYNERVELEFRRWKRHGDELSMALIDVDFFKKINDNYGHAAGDKTLQVIAQNINNSLRSTDFLARWGGEEFVVLLPGTASEELNKPLEAIRKKVQRIPFKFKEQKVSITVSIGATSFNAGDSIDKVFERADASLYEAKNSGRNKTIIQAG